MPRISFSEGAGRKALAGCLIFVLLPAALRGQEAQDFQLTVCGGLHRQAAYGSDKDYVRGENDFPVTPAHTSGLAGFNLTYFFTPRIGLQLGGRFVRSAEVTSRDPSDGDTLTFETSRHFTLTLDVILEFPLGRVRPYLAVGGGADRMEARSERLTTAFGHEIIVEDLAESGLIDPVLEAGGGLRVFLFKGLGLNLDGRYVVVLDRPNALQGLCLEVGLAWRL